MAVNKKESDNTAIEHIGTMPTENCPDIEPVTKTLIDRYVFAANWCKDKKVLDCPIAHGYGAMILKSLGAAMVRGFDIDVDAIVKCGERYKDVSAYDVNMTEDWSKNNSHVSVDKYDVVVSIEGFEHVPRETVPQMLKNFKQACTPGGYIIISTPQRFTPKWEYPGGTHLYEYTLNEFLDELGKEFNNIKIYFAVEFRHKASEELNTVFTDKIEYAPQAAVMMAIIKNE